MVHDIVTVYYFLQKLLNKYVKTDFLHVYKVFNFSDSSGAQYKNFKNFTNLPLHEQDFDLKAGWHFFATSHGKNACDGVGCTIKRLAAHASLQRPISNQILTPLQLFEFANVEIHFFTSFISTEYVDQVVQFLQPRFLNSPKFKGTRKNHQFIPVGNNIQMSCVSRDSGRADLINTPGVNIVNIFPMKILM